MLNLLSKEYFTNIFWENISQIKLFYKKHLKVSRNVIVLIALILLILFDSLVFYNKTYAMLTWAFGTSITRLPLPMTILLGMIVLSIWMMHTFILKSLYKKHLKISGCIILLTLLILFDLFIFYNEISAMVTWIYDLGGRKLLLFATFAVIMIVLFSSMVYAPMVPIILSLIVLLILIISLIVVMFDLDPDKKIYSLLGVSGKYKAVEYIVWGMGGVIGAIVATAINRRADAQERNNKLEEKGHDNTRFQNIIGDLGHCMTTVRMTAFYRFFYLAEKEQETSEKTNKFRKDVFEILCSHLRAISAKELKPDEINSEHWMECQTLFDILFKDNFKSIDVKKQNLAPQFPIDLRNIPFRILDPAKANLSGAKLSMANLSGVNFLQTKFSDADISGAKFSNTNLAHANFSNTTLSNATFFRANLARANLSGAKLSNADLSGANLVGANLSGANLVGASLLGTNLSGANLSGANLSVANLLHANLLGANLSNTTLQRTQFMDVQFMGAKLLNADFSNARFRRVDFLGANLSKVNFSNARFWRVIFLGANLSKANFSNARLWRGIFFGANLSKAVFNRARLQNTKLKHVYGIKDAGFNGTTIDRHPITPADLS